MPASLTRAGLLTEHPLAETATRIGTYTLQKLMNGWLDGGTLLADSDCLATGPI